MFEEVKSLLVRLLFFLGTIGCVHATYPIGSREIPAVVVQPNADAFTVYEQHPRLFFRDTDLPEIRRRIANDVKPEWEEMLASLSAGALKRPAKTYGEGVFLKSWETGRNVAFVAAITGEPRYVAWARDWTAALVAAGPVGNDDNYRGRLQSLAVAYDWLYPLWTDTEKHALQEAIIAHVGRNWSFGEKPSFVSGHSRWGNFALAAGLLAIVTERPEMRAKLQLIRRNWIEGYFPAQGWIAVDGGYHMGWSYSAAYLTGGIHLAWSTATNECVFFPWQAKLPAFWLYGRQGDRTYPNTGDAYTVTKDLSGSDRAQALIAAGILKDPYAAGALTKTADRFTDVLYADKSVRGRAPNDAKAPLPLSRHFRNAGVVLARDTWDDNATLLQFKSTSFYSINHHHRDENSFTLHYRAPLAIDSGYYDSYGSTHWKNYFTRTIAHNAIVVCDPTQSYLMFGKPVTNDGGQIMLPEPSTLADIDVGGPAHLGGITSYEDTPDYMHAAGDATKAYDPQRVRLAEREIVYLRHTDTGRPIVVVLDRVESTKPDLVKKFLLHTVNEPKVRGNLAVAENKASRLTSLTLLPDHAKIERIGGPGREAWVDGKNHPFETTKTLGPEFTTGSWRLEISPAAPQLRDTFLHVLWVDDATSPAVNPAAARLMKTADSVSVRVGGWTVQFPLDRTGKSTVVATR
jgi:hypothetical protein